MSEATEPEVEHQPEEHAFQAEVNQVLDIVIHSLYSNPEIFLRELISNAADAIDKLRFRAVTEHDLIPAGTELEIRIVPDQAARTLTIGDTGVGMTKDELKKNLGTVAHSGSKEFIARLKEKKQGGDGVDLIGQFGVGFYSAFLVAEEVEVLTRPAGLDEAWCWRSSAHGTFTIEPAPEWTIPGTEVRLRLKEDHQEYLDGWRLRELVRRYSDFVSFPIKLRVEKKDDESSEASFETINQARALWRRPRTEISDEEYEEFYKHLTRDYEAPLAHAHFTIEGTQVYTGLLYLPKRPPFDLFDRDQRRGVRLYVKRVFIMDECKELVPEWLRFVRGVIDSDDLPLNVSRELLQEDKIVRAIRGSIVSKTLALLGDIAKEKPEDYREFWTSFGAVLKEGLHYDPSQREKLADLARFTSSKEDFTSLAEYVERMPAGQDSIYYAIGTDRRSVEGSPHLEVLKKRGFEVLYLTDHVDEWAVQGLHEYREKPLVSAMRADLTLDDSEVTEEKAAERKQRTEELQALGDKFESVLEDSVSDVRVSNRLTDSPCCLVVPEGGLHAHTERLLRAHGQSIDAPKRILEINPEHPVIRRLHALHEKDPEAQDLDAWIHLLHDQARLAEGSPLEDPQGFAQRMARLMTKALTPEGPADASD